MHLLAGMVRLVATMQDTNLAAKEGKVIVRLHYSSDLVLRSLAAACLRSSRRRAPWARQGSLGATGCRRRPRPATERASRAQQAALVAAALCARSQAPLLVASQAPVSLLAATGALQSHLRAARVRRVERMPCSWLSPAPCCRDWSETRTAEERPVPLLFGLHAVSGEAPGAV